MKSTFRIIVCLLMLLAVAAASEAATYRYELVKENPFDNIQYVSFRSGISINNRETAAVAAAVTGGFLSVFTYGQPITQTFGGRCTTGCYMTSINDAGTVAFVGSEPVTRDGIFLYDDPIIFAVDERAVTRVAEGLDLDNSVSINQRGALAFSRKSGAKGGVYVSQGTVLTRISEQGTLHASPVINNHGVVAFYVFSDKGSSIVTGNGGTLNVVARDHTEAFPAFVFHPTGTLAFNDSETVVFITQLAGGKTGIVKAEGGRFSTVAESGVFERFSTVALNNNGQVAFQAHLTPPESGQPVSGIYTGPDATADKVIAIGDRLFDSSVTQLAFWRDGLNDAGHIAFLAALADGRQVVVRAVRDCGTKAAPSAAVFRFPF